MTSLLLIAFGFVLLVVETAVSTRAPLYGFAPNLVLPMAIYLGVSAEVELVRGVLVSFVLGYLLDSFCGNAMGLQTFVLTASFVVARGAGLRLFPQGPLFQVLMTFVMALAFSATVLSLRAIFEQPQVAGLRVSATDTLRPVLWSAAVTALVGPAIFGLARRIDSLGAPKREERTVSS